MSIEEILMFGFESKDFVNDLVGKERLAAAAAQIEQHYLGLLPEKRDIAISGMLDTQDETIQKIGYNQAVDQMAKNIRGQ